jgi:hypothetical protein
MANGTYQRNSFLECGSCPESNSGEQEYTPIFNGPTNSTITPAVLRKFANPIMRVQRGYANWSAPPCGTFESDTGFPTNTANSNSIYTKRTKISSCSSSYECENNTYPTRKSETIYTIDSENGSCTTTREEVQPCSDNVDCAETFDTYYEFSFPQTSLSQWTEYNTSRHRNYDFYDVYNVGNEYYWSGAVISYRINKSFIDPITSDPIGYLRNSEPKLSVRCHNLVIGFNYIFGYDKKYRQNPNDDWTITKVRTPFTATEHTKDFGSILENPSSDDEDDYNAMGSVALSDNEGYHEIGGMGIIIDFQFNNCSTWR